MYPAVISYFLIADIDRKVLADEVDGCGTKRAESVARRAYMTPTLELMGEASVERERLIQSVVRS